MSLTSYRAAPPRDESDADCATLSTEMEDWKGASWGDLLGLAATYSSALLSAVPSALRVFTAEFGMGSGVWPLAMATRPPGSTRKPVGLPGKPGGRLSGGCHVADARSVDRVAAASASAGAGAAGQGIGVLPLHAAVYGGTRGCAGDQARSSD